VLKNSSAVLTIDNRDRQVGESPFNFRVKFPQSVQNIRRVAFLAASFDPIAGNVNPKNNNITLTFLGGPSAGTRTFNLPSGYYETGADVVAAFAPVLAFEAPGLALVWNNITRRFTFTYTGVDLFFIDPTCPFIVYGRNMWGFVPSSTPQLTIVSEKATLRFNTILSIRSNRFTQFEKNNSTATNPKISDVFNMILYSDLGLVRVNDFNFVPEYRSYEPQTQITDADVSILDEWGDSPATYTDSPNNWVFQMQIITQV
jgi:hypothetical protein